MAPENLAGPSDFKAFRHCFLCFASRNRLWHKEPGKYALDRTWQEEFGVPAPVGRYTLLTDSDARRVSLPTLSHVSLLHLDRPLAEPLLSLRLGVFA
jgi:hypothetical protein